MTKDEIAAYHNEQFRRLCEFRQVQPTDELRAAYDYGVACQKEVFKAQVRSSQFMQELYQMMRELGLAPVRRMRASAPEGRHVGNLWGILS